MALVLADRVQETSTTTGTGTLTLAGASSGYQTFSAGIGNGNTCYYTIQSDTGAWEVGIGTVGAGTLARTTLISSSTGSKIAFSGTLTVFVTYPAEKAVYSDSTTIVAPSGALLPVTNGGTGASTAAAALTSLGAYPASNPSGYGTGTITAVTGTAPVVSSGGTTPAISMAAATASVNGYLTSTDWSTFNSKGAGTVTSVTATAPVTSTGGATPVIAMPAATTSVNGYLTSTDWTTFNNKINASAGSVISSYIASGAVGTTQLASASVTPAILSQPFTSGTAVASTSGTSISFTGIPSWAKRITLMFNGVSLSGLSAYLVQIGSGSTTTSGYVSMSGYTAASLTSTAGFVIFDGAASNTHSGILTICLISANNYVSSHNFGVGTVFVSGGGNSPALSGALDRVVITTVNGTDTFDAGTINILYE